MHPDDVRSAVLTAVVADEWCLVREGVRSLAGSFGIVSRVLASTATEALAELGRASSSCSGRARTHRRRSPSGGRGR